MMYCGKHIQLDRGDDAVCGVSYHGFFYQCDACAGQESNFVRNVPLTLESMQQNLINIMEESSNLLIRIMILEDKFTEFKRKEIEK